MENKSIKIYPESYRRLDEIRVKGETFAQVVARLIYVFDHVSSIKDTLGPSHYLAERPNIDAYAGDHSIKARTLQIKDVEL